MSMTASIFLGTSSVAIVAVGAGVVVLARRRWEWAIALVVAADVLTWSWVSGLKDTGNVVYWGGVLGVGCAFLLEARTSRAARRLIVGIAVVTVALAATGAWSIDRHATLRQTATFASVLVVAAFAAVQLRRSRAEGDRLVRALAPLVPAILLVTVLVIVADHARSVAEGGGVSGFVDGANALGIIIAVAFPFLLAAGWMADRTVLLVVTMGIVMFVVTLSASRTGMVAVFLGFAVFELGRRRWARLVFGGAAALAGLVFAVVWVPDVPTLGRPLAPVVVKQPLSQVPQSKDLFGGGRVANQSLFSSLVGARDEAWREAVHLLPKRPVLGSGFGTGSDIFAHDHVRRNFVLFVGAFDPTANVHQGYLQELLELGLLGGIVFLALPLAALGLAIVRLWRGWGSLPEGAFAATVVAALFSALFESIFAGFGAITMLTWLAIAGLCVSAMTERAAVRRERTRDVSALGSVSSVDAWGVPRDVH